MKKLLILLLLISVHNCSKDSTSINLGEKYFDPQKLSQLSLEDFDSFWQGEEINNISDYITANFNTNFEFLGAIRYSSENKDIGVSVFKTRSDAVSAMEQRINQVACVIIPGDSDDLFTSNWWFTDCIPNGIFVNHLNTIIELGYYHSDYGEIEDFMIQSAAEVARRVDYLSE